MSKACIYRWSDVHLPLLGRCSPCSLTWCMPVALSSCHRSHRSARVVSITLKISNTVWNNTNPHCYSKIKHRSAFISVDENIRCARLGCNDATILGIAGRNLTIVKSAVTESSASGCKFAKDVLLYCFS